MKFMKGSKVEVLTKKEVSIGSWLCAEIICGNGHTYSVRYGCSPMASEALVEKVPRKAIRPCPPPVEGVNNWVPGDHVEVFQNMSWKTATVVNSLGGNIFLVRLLGKSQEFSAHTSHLRVRQCWQDDKWFVIGKGNSKLYPGNDCFQIEKKRGIQEPHISTGALKRVLPVGLNYFETHNAAGQKARAIEKDGRPRRISAECSSLLNEKVDVYIPPQEKLGLKFAHANFRVGTTGVSELEVCRGESYQSYSRSHLGTPRSVDTGSITCSVGSCSVNGDRLPFFSVKYENKDTENLCSDADSICGREYEEEGSYLSEKEELVTQGWGYEEETFYLYKKKELVVQKHRLELYAYRRAMKALFANGPLSWEDEMKVTDIRQSLNISDDEHLVEHTVFVLWNLLMLPWNFHDQVGVLCA